MNKTACGHKGHIRIICLALTIIFSASFAAAGVVSDSGCGMQCCCTKQLADRHHAHQVQLRSLVGCCAGSSQMPCDLTSTSEPELPAATLASSTGQVSPGGGPAGPIDEILIGRQDQRDHIFDHYGRDKFRSPPLYLQNLSFLI